MSTANIFRVPITQIEGRLDPEYYLGVYRHWHEKFDACIYPTARLSQLQCTVFQGVGRSIDAMSKVTLLKVKNILSSGAIDYSDTEQISSSEVPTHKLLQKNDIITPFIGQAIKLFKFAIYEKIGDQLHAVDNNTGVIRISDPRLIPEFAHYFFQTTLIQWQIKQLIGGGGVPFIGSAAKRFRVPLPPLNKQQEIIQLMREAYAQKTQLESEAKALLDSVDVVLYRHWGCSSPSLPEGSLTQRIFKVSISSIDDRLDAPANWTPFDLRSPLHPSIRLNKVAAINPSTDFSNVGNDDTVSFVPMDCVDEVWGEVMERHSRPYSESKGYTEFQEGDVLWAKITPCMQNGKSAIAQGLLHQRGFGSTEFHVFRVDAAQLDARYLLAVLRLKYLRQFAALFFGGSAGHQRVDASFFQKLAIPLPPLTVQQKIATEIEALKTQAQTLRQLAHATLDQARQQVEKMILGESA